MPMTDTARLDALEMRIVHQDEVIEDLNRVVTAQWKEIDRLTREVAALMERVNVADQSSSAGGGDEPPPPHY
jgi:SlyX protein